MTFLSNIQPHRPVMGSADARILIVGDCPDQWAVKAGKPIAHASETVLQGALHQAGLLTYEVLITNLVYDSTNLAKYWREDGHKGSGQLRASIADYKRSLLDFIQVHEPKIIVAMGELVAFAILGRSKLTDIRGYPFKTETHGFTVIPTLHPRKMIWSNHEWRYYLSHDLKKARELSNNPALLLQRRYDVIPESFQHAILLLDKIKSHLTLSIDIEVDNFEISCVGFAPDREYGYSIPFDMRWTEEEEVELWKRVANILEDREIVKIFQNGIFDIHFLAQKMGIFVQPINGKYIEDTMIAHSIMYPDFLKGLGFLASVHTYEPYWKDELESKTIKKES